MDALNIARDKALVQEEIRFIRQSPAQPPEPPEPPKKPLPEVIVDPETGDEYNAPIAAFFEEVTDDEAAETLQQLLDLGHEVHLLPEADRAEYLANKSNQEPEVPDGDRNK